MEVLLEEIYKLKDVDYSLCESMEDVLMILKSDMSLIEEEKKNICDAKKMNNYDIFIIKIQNFFNVFSIEDSELLEDDNVFLDEEMNLICKFLLYYNSLLKIINEENYKDVYKLVLFIGEYYALNTQYLENMRDTLDFFSRGIGYSNGEIDDTRYEFDKFFNREFNRISLIKPVQKKL